MSRIWRSLLRDERGFVITAELVLISSVLVLGLVVALNTVKTAIAGELGDVAGAIGSLNQSYYTHGFHGCCTTNGAASSRTYGSAFLDKEDSSDEQEADFATGVNATCTKTACVTAPCNTPAPCATPQVPCATGCGTPCGAAPCGAVPCGTPSVPCDSGCGSPCGSAPCGTATAPCATGCGTPSGSAPCGASPCGAAPCGSAPCGSASGGCGSGCGSSSGGYITNFSGYGASVPPVICPPGPAPFTGTDPFAPGVVSPQNMLLQGISYGGVCAPPLPQPPMGAELPFPAPGYQVPNAPAATALIPAPPKAALRPANPYPAAPAVIY